MRPIIKEAREKGIVITTMNTPLPDLESEYKTAGFGYAGADLFTAGYNLGKKSSRSLWFTSW
jgi:simple sugar transport system substrate-binding protein